MDTYTFLCRVLLVVTLLGVSASSQSQTQGRSEIFQSVDLVVKDQGLDIGGTLLVPAIAETEVLVVLSSGSGWQDRDSTIFDFRMFKIIAEHLASEGIASFRYDDRGVGTSTGDFVNSTIDDLTADIHRIMAFFTNNSEYPYQNFVLLGHSQGGIVAAKAANNYQSVGGVVLVASPAVTIGELISSQTRQEYTDLAQSTSKLEALVSANNQLLRSVLHKNGIDAALENFKQIYASVMGIENTDSGLSDLTSAKRVNDIANNHRVNYGLPSLTSFVDYDPLADIKALQVPVLSLYGGRDSQVPIEPNKDLLETVLIDNIKSYNIVIFDEANHFFQASKTGLAEEYGTLDKHFVEGFLEELSAWILALDAQ